MQICRPIIEQSRGRRENLVGDGFTGYKEG